MSLSTRNRGPSKSAIGRTLALFLASCLALSMTSSFAYAAYQATLTGSNFEIDTDANFVRDVTSMDDWATVAEARNTDKPTGTNDDSYSGGVKEDTVCPKETTGSIPNNKSDLKTFGTWVETGSPGFLHMFWTRVSDPSGTTLMDFEFNKSKTKCADGPNVIRTIGDRLFEYSITQGGAQATITMRTWDGSAWSSGTPLLPSDATGTINSSPITAANSDGNGALSARTFGEASINLKAIFDANKCESFGSAMLKSRSSDSFTSQLKDFISPIPINLTNCGKVIIHKQTDPASTVDFSFAKSFGTDPTTANTFTLADNGTQTFENVLLGSGYTVNESSTLPSGWDFVSVDCSASVGVSPTIAGAQVTFAIDAVSDVLECTYYNEARAKLTVVKKTRDTTGTFAFTTTGGLSPATFDLTTTAVGDAGAASQSFTNLNPGAYSVAETVPTNWNLDAATCDNGDAPSAITLEAGDDVTCTFTNELERGALVITKLRKHAADGSGDHPQSGVTFTVKQGATTLDTVTTDATGKACLPNLLYGDYTVVETVPAGYVSDDVSQDVTISAEASCAGGGTANAASVTFHNTPLTTITVTVDSQVVGGTASTIRCVNAADVVLGSGSTNATTGDGSVTVTDLLPTDPAATLICTVVVDP